MRHTHSVSNKPGKTAFTRTFGPWVWASDFIRCIPAALLTEYASELPAVVIACSRVNRCYSCWKLDREFVYRDGRGDDEHSAIGIVVESGQRRTQERHLSLYIDSPALMTELSTHSLIRGTEECLLCPSPHPRARVGRSSSSQIWSNPSVGLASIDDRVSSMNWKATACQLAV